MSESKIIIPPNSTAEGHEIIEKTLFVISDIAPQGNMSARPPNFSFLNVGDKVIVLEESVGYEGRWNKVSFNESSGFCYKSSVAALEGTKKSILVNLDKQFLPDINATEIEWTSQDSNTVYFDKKAGKYCIHYDTGYDKLTKVNNSSEQDLKDKMSEALISGSSLIMQEYGKKYDIDYINSLYNDYYLFGQAEKYSFTLRNCSTLRVLVTIPARYVQSEEIKEAELSYFDGIQEVELPGSDEELLADEQPRYLKIDFKNYKEFDDFFEHIRDTLDISSFIYKSRTWDITPDTINLDFRNELALLNAYQDKITAFLFNNIPKEEKVGLVDEIKRDIDNFFEKDAKWKGSLTLYIDQNDIQLKLIEYRDQKRNKVKLSVGTLSFIEDETITNKTIVNYIINKKLIDDRPKDKKDDKFAALHFSLSVDFLSLFSKVERSFKDFVLEYHYPKLDSIEAQQLDIASCISDAETLYNELKNYKLPEYKKTLRSFRTKNEKDGYWKTSGDDIKKVFKDATKVRDPNLRLLLGVDSPPKNLTKLQTAGKYLSAIKALNTNKLFQEIMKCATRTISAQDLAQLLEKYKKARGNIEAALYATLCNPFLMSAGKKITSFQLPQFPTYNPNGNLGQMLLEYYVKTITDLVILVIRKQLNDMLQNCLRNPNSTANPENNANSILDNLADPSVGNEPAVNDLLGDFSEDPTLFDGLGSEEARKAALEKLKSFIEDFCCFLTTRELCDLLRGRATNKEAIDAVRSLVRNKYPELKSKLTNESDIKAFFAKLGSAIDLTLCDEMDNFTGIIPKTCLCDDGTIEALRRQLLDDKNLDPAMIDDSLNDIKEKERKNLENLMKFLDEDAPFDLSSVPSVFCKFGPNGEIIPPAVDMGNSQKSFSKMLNTLTKDIYDVFDEEASVWYKSTYSIYKPNAEQVLVFNESTGKIEPKQNTGKPPEKTKDGKDVTVDSTAAKTSDELKHSYLFNKYLNNLTASFGSQVINNSLFVSNIDSKDQQLLDVNFIGNEFRIELEKEEEKFNKFVEIFVNVIAYFTLLGIFNFAEEQSYKNFSFFNFLKDLSSKLKMFDLVVRNYKKPEDNDQILKIFSEQSKITELDKSNGLFFTENGASLYAYLMNYLTQKQNESDLTDFLSFLDNNKNQPDRSGIDPQLEKEFNNIIGSNQVDPNTKLLSNLWKEVSFGYSSIKNKIEVLTNLKISYPSYVFSSNIDYNISDVPPAAKSVNTGSLHDFYMLDILRNNNQYLKIIGDEKYSDEILNYIKQNLGLTTENNYYKKAEIFDSYIKLINKDTSFTNFYEEEQNNILKSLIYKLKLDSNESTRINHFVSENLNNNNTICTRNLKLVIPQSPDQKVCNVRPSFLDIDNLKDAASKKKSESYCIEDIVNEKIQQNLPIDSNELAQVETNETQTILLEMAHKLTIRAYVTDIILRGYGIFSYLDPQVLRYDPKLIDFLGSVIESEIRAVDQTYFDMLTTFLVKQYLRINVEQDEAIANTIFFKRKLLKNVIKEELIHSVLPKLSKRIDIDTKFDNGIPKINLKDLYDECVNLNYNFKYTKESPSTIPVFSSQEPTPIFKLITQNYSKLFSIAEENNEVYFVKTEDVELTNEQANTQALIELSKQRADAIARGEQIDLEKINFLASATETKTTKIKIFNGTKSQFRASTEFKLLFEYLFPVKRMITDIFISNVLCTSTRKQTINTFKGTEKNCRKLTKLIQTNGQPIAPDLNNIQDMMDADNSDSLLWFILKALIETPLKIAKGFIELVDPNLFLASNLYKISKAYDPNISSTLIPALSLAELFLFIFPNPLFYPIYMGFGLWYENNDKDSKNASFLKKALKEFGAVQTQNITCPVPNDDIVKIDKTKDIYLLSNS
jgi:hypothetical protein